MNFFSPESLNLGKNNLRGYFEFRHRLADRSIRDVAVYSGRILMKEGELLHSIVHDITERKKLENEQKADQERIRAILDATADSIVVYDISGKATFINQTFSRVFGWSLEELAGPKIPYVPEEEHAVRNASIEEMLTQNKMVHLEARRLTKDGKTLDVLVNASPMVDGNGRPIGYMACMTDITRMKEMEREIRQAQKMEAIGSLAGGIAHDFNNILFPISGLAQISLLDAPQGSVLQQNLEKIYDATRRAADLVQQILNFSRRAEMKKTPVMLQPIVKEVFKLTRSTIPANIEMQIDVQPEIIRVMGDATQLHQVLMNLITNAYHAVENSGGSIRVELMEATLEKDRPIGGPSLPAGRYALIRVSDTGYGIDPAILDKIFEPYFTTKPQGKGTGLGLAVVHGIVKELGGDIQCESWMGSGTVFHVYLPLLVPQEDETPVSPGKRAEVPGGSERILLVDDEKPIVDMERRLLERLGYTVDAFWDSEEALTCFEADPLRFDMMLTDMSMPKMTGVMLAERVLAIRPGMPIILCTGYTETIDEKAAKAIGIRAFAPKPLAVEELAVMIRQVLEGKMLKA